MNIKEMLSNKKALYQFHWQYFSQWCNLTINDILDLMKFKCLFLT